MAGRLNKFTKISTNLIIGALITEIILFFYLFKYHCNLYIKLMLKMYKISNFKNVSKHLLTF